MALRMLCKAISVTIKRMLMCYRSSSAYNLHTKNLNRKIIIIKTLVAVMINVTYILLNSTDETSVHINYWITTNTIIKTHENADDLQEKIDCSAS